MKDNELELDEFNILEMLSSGCVGTYSRHAEIPIISVTETVIGIGKKAIDFIQAKHDLRAVLLEKKGIWYLAVLPFDSKIKGYKISMTSKKSKTMLIFNCRASQRGVKAGYYKLLEPIYVSGLDLFELEEFDINK